MWRAYRRRMVLSDPPQNASAQSDTQRVTLMRACAHATAEEILHAIDAIGHTFQVEDVRPAESGLVMVRGRIGGDGASFNAGEVTVTRAVVKLDNGRLGYSYLLGRAKEKARLAAIADALGHDPRVRDQLQHVLVDKVEERCAAERRRRQEETAATRVNFFTLVRGED